MKKQILAAGVLCATLFAITAKTKDPVLMKVGDNDVRLSEFEYLYHKNNAQQAKPQTIDEYVDMFVNFKLKVAAAEAAGLDTTQAFRDEFVKFRNELSDPYLRDKATEDSIVAEAYNHILYDVTVSHIMLPPSEKAKADSLRADILAGKISYEDAARTNSIDKPSAVRGGLMGTVTAGRYPWAFEKASYDTPVGGISEVINSGFGNHIIRVESRRPSKGQVHAAHILRTTRGMSDSVAADQKRLIDSIYTAATAPGADFADLASRFSQDPGSARRGGDLGFFGSGMMVQEFDSTAFALADGEISRPFRTAFGWHIINRIESKGPGSLEDNREAIDKAIQRDPARSHAPVEVFADNAVLKYKGKLNEKTFAAVAAMADRSAGVMDSAFIASMAASKLPAFSIGGKNTTLAQLAPYIPSVAPEGTEALVAFVRNSASDLMKTKAMELAREELEATNPDYRNLVNEYRDGILLFDISNREVWDRATTDTTGLENYFRANRDKYRWDSPRFKGIVIFAGNDSLLNVAAKYAADSIPASVPSADVAALMNSRFGRDIKVERVIAAKGENAITDCLGFGAEKPATPLSKRWPSFTAFRGEILEQPAQAADVRAAVVADYQAELERLWLERLHKEIPVKINKKVLGEAK